MGLERSWVETALTITGGFETTGDPFAEIAGDFDGQGLSCGALQWNVGQGTLQPLVVAAGRDALMAQMPIYGSEFWSAVENPVSEALGIVRAWQTDGVLRREIRGELAAFWGGTEMRAQQIAAAGHIADLAYGEATFWAKDRSEFAPTKKEFCWFFDLVTQNGGLKGVSLADVRAFGDGRTPGGAITAICNWLASRPPKQADFSDCHRNATLWRAAVTGADLDLLVLSYLRCLKAAEQFRGGVLNRKGAIAVARGWVNGALADLSEYFD